MSNYYILLYKLSIMIDQNTQLVLTIAIPAMVTIIGFILNYYQIVKNLTSEINKQKTFISLEKCTDTITILYDSIRYFIKYVNKNDYKSFEDSILAARKGTTSLVTYGNHDSCNIAIETQMFINEMEIHAVNNKPMEARKYIIYIVLCICQLKYEITGVELSPKQLYRTFRCDADEYIQISNKIVDELKLKQFLKT